MSLTAPIWSSSAACVCSEALIFAYNDVKHFKMILYSFLFIFFDITDLAKVSTVCGLFLNISSCLSD